MALETVDSKGLPTQVIVSKQGEVWGYNGGGRGGGKESTGSGTVGHDGVRDKEETTEVR